MEEKRKNKRTDLDINVSLGIITEDATKEKEYIDVEITIYQMFSEEDE